eukprot:COSAG01_NODE_7973_length_2968_cov_8.650052_1_plen_186_part_00
MSAYGYQRATPDFLFTLRFTQGLLNSWPGPGLWEACALQSCLRTTAAHSAQHCCSVLVVAHSSAQAASEQPGRQQPAAAAEANRIYPVSTVYHHVRPHTTPPNRAAGTLGWGGASSAGWDVGGWGGGCEGGHISTSCAVWGLESPMFGQLSRHENWPNSCKIDPLHPVSPRPNRPFGCELRRAGC